MTARIAFEEIAKRMGRTVAEVETEARELGLTVQPDWAGRPSLSEVDAGELVSGSARAHQEHLEGWRRYQAECKQWTRDRDAAVRQAYLSLADRSGVVSGEQSERARELGREAGRRFEAEHPVPLFNGRDYKVARREYTEEAGFVSRAVSLIRSMA